MTDADREWLRLVRQFQDCDRRLRDEPRPREPVLPADLDVDAELDRCFSEPGQTVWVSVV